MYLMAERIWAKAILLVVSDSFPSLQILLWRSPPPAYSSTRWRRLGVSTTSYRRTTLGCRRNSMLLISLESRRWAWVSNLVLSRIFRATLSTRRTNERTWRHHTTVWKLNGSITKQDATLDLFTTSEAESGTETTNKENKDWHLMLEWLDDGLTMASFVIQINSQTLIGSSLYFNTISYYCKLDCWTDNKNSFNTFEHYHQQLRWSHLSNKNLKHSLVLFPNMRNVSVLYRCWLNIFGFWIVGQTKHLKTSPWTLGTCNGLFY